jgi:hypothetical protein
MSPRIQGRSISRSIASPRSNITAFFGRDSERRACRGDVVWFGGASRLVFHGVEGYPGRLFPASPPNWITGWENQSDASANRARSMIDGSKPTSTHTWLAAVSAALISALFFGLNAVASKLLFSPAAPAHFDAVSLFVARGFWSLPLFLFLALATMPHALLSSETKCNTPADLIIGTADQDLRECCHAMLFAFVG